MAKTLAQVKTSLENFVTRFVALLAELDDDAGVTGTGYEAACTPVVEPNDCMEKFNRCLALLDKDLLVDEDDYLAKLKVSFQSAQAIAYYDQVDHLFARLGALSAKLNEDLGVTDTTYTAGTHPA